LAYEQAKRGVEVGVQNGLFSESILNRWKTCKNYLLVDLWAKQSNYADSANTQNHELAFKTTKRRLQRFSSVRICRNFSTTCASQIENESVDFVYLDARHDYLGVFEDINVYWPKLRRGGIFAGHDFIVASEHDKWQTRAADYALNGDGTRDPWERSVRGAVDEFFTQCVPRQVTVTYRDGNAMRSKFNPVFNTWMVRK
jgi:predicted O-methyltransferase YrrM